MFDQRWLSPWFAERREPAARVANRLTPRDERALHRAANRSRAAAERR